jgi:hypothetical protein
VSQRERPNSGCRWARYGCAMVSALKNTLLSARDLLVTAGPVALLALALIALAFWLLDPMPPKHVVLATGPEQSAYDEFGLRYAAALKAQGITVTLRRTQGAAENLALLRDPDSGVDLAFAQGGAADLTDDNAAADDDGLVSLGSLFQEPVWLFYRGESAQKKLKKDQLESLQELAGWTVQTGAAGSGWPNLVRRLLDANHIDPATITLRNDPQTPAVMSLLAGDADAVVFASAPESAMVQMLLQTPGIRLFNVTQAEAYARRFAFLTPVTLPRGVVDLAGDVPPQDMHLIAPTASLVARDSTHPALLQLFVQTAQRLHGEAGWFQRKGEFPNPANTERPLSKEADRLYRNGAPLMQRYLPFWVANLFDRMWVVLLSIVAILIPLSRVVPPLYAFRIRSRIFRWYGQLRAVETAQGQRPEADLLKELDRIDAHVNQISVPLSYADELYALRAHIQWVRRRVTQPA